MCSFRGSYKRQMNVISGSTCKRMRMQSEASRFDWTDKCLPLVEVSLLYEVMGHSSGFKAKGNIKIPEPSSILPTFYTCQSSLQTHFRSLPLKPQVSPIFIFSPSSTPIESSLIVKVITETSTAGKIILSDAINVAPVKYLQGSRLRSMMLSLFALMSPWINLGTVL